MTHPHTAWDTPAADLRGTTPALASPAELHGHLTTHLGGAARAWLDQALNEAAAQPGIHGPISVWELRLAEAGRRCGPEHADAARVLILHTARAGTDALTRVYFQAPPPNAAPSSTPCPTSSQAPKPSRSSRTPCAPTTPGSSPPPSARTPPGTSPPTPGAMPS